MMQLVRVVEVGLDADGDGQADLDPSRIYYSGHSQGSNIGTMLMATDPSVRAATLFAPGGSVIDSARLGINRGGTGAFLAARTPSSINSPGITSLDGLPAAAPHFNESMPLRNDSNGMPTPLSVRLSDGTTHVIQSPVINTAFGAMEIQRVIEHREWVAQSGDAVAYAPYLMKQPLPGVDRKPTLILFAKGDQTVPNPMATAILRAGELAEHTTFMRTDLVFQDEPTLRFTQGGAKNPHNFALFPNSANSVEARIAREVQKRSAEFLASDGFDRPEPKDWVEVPSHWFEVPIVPPLPEALNFIP
jgi:hypothetical protein